MAVFFVRKYMLLVMIKFKPSGRVSIDLMKNSNCVFGLVFHFPLQFKHLWNTSVWFIYFFSHQCHMTFI